MTNHPNETPEPLAGPSVESCATALAEALRREKGWLLDYGHSVIRDAIDRKHLEPLAKEQAGEYRSLYELSGCITDANTMLIGRYELKAKDAEIAGLKADARMGLEFTETQCIDLFAAALYISARGDETSVLSEENADRISEFLCDLAGVDLDAMKGEAA